MESLIAYRWRLVSKSLGLSFPYPFCLKLIFMGHYFNQILPSMISGDAFRIYYIKKNGSTNLSVASASVISDRLFGLFGLVIIGLVAGGYHLFFERFALRDFVSEIITIENNPFTSDLILTFFLIIVIATIFVIVAARIAKSFFAKKILPLAIELKCHIKCIRKSDYLPTILVISIATQLFPVLIIYTFVNLNFDYISFANISFIVPLVLIASLLPISIAGWGVREATFSGLFLFFGYSIEVGLIAGLAYGLINLGAGMIGGCLLIKNKWE